MYAQHMSKVLGQQFYVENRGGAGNMLGIDSVVRSPADGYTLLLGAGHDHHQSSRQQEAAL